MARINTQPKYLVVIAGPTAVGKTDLAIELARHYGSVILSADARQFYREMSIGTAKPAKAQLREVPHYFIGHKSIGELYGAGHFARDAQQLLGTLFEQQDIVFAVGGSGLYINALLYGVDDFAEVPAEIRAQLNARLATEGLEPLQQLLEKLDPDYYQVVDLRNPQRIIRALEVCLHSGQPYSSFLKKKDSPVAFTAIKILLNLPREILYERINRRVDQMMEAGLLSEVKALSDQRHLNALKTVGYRELYEYLDGECDLGTAVEKIKQHTRNYAKRQLTWFKNQDEYEEFSPENMESIKAYIDVIRRHG